MKNYKIRKKLLVAFSTLITLIAVICASSIFAMLNSDKQTKDMYNLNVLAMQALGNMKNSYQLQGKYTRNLILVDANTQTYTDSIAAITNAEEDMKIALDAYEKTITEKEDRDTFNKIKDIYLNEYATLKTDLIDLTGKNDRSKATEELLANAHINADLQALFDKLDGLNEQYANQTVQNADSVFKFIMIAGIALFAVSVLIGIILTAYLTKLIANPIEKIAQAANQLAVGDVDVSISVETKDEIGDLSDAFNFMVQEIGKQVKIVESISDGDLTVECEPRSDKDIMGNSLKKTLRSLNDMFKSISIASEQVRVGSEQVSNGAQALSQGATEQASSIEELSASILDVSDDITKNAKNVDKATEYVEQTVLDVNKSNEEMQKMLSAMNDISLSSNEISKINKVIEDIAFQTNILALNAAVEAARAGSAGKGFAVVADEVRNLASKSADAAKQTTALIEGSISVVSEGSEIAKNTASALDEVYKNSILVKEIIEKIDVASQKQAVAIAQINLGIEQVSAVIQTNSATAEESAAASEELSGQALVLHKEVEKFELSNDSQKLF